jgi:hypothetical protein
MTMSFPKPSHLQTRAVGMGRATQVATKPGGISAKLGSSLRPYASEMNDAVKFGSWPSPSRAETLEFFKALESIKADVACFVADIGVSRLDSGKRRNIAQ